jgi:hypothetical protein
VVLPTDTVCEPGEGAGPIPHTIRYDVGDNRIDLVLDDGAKSSLWWATKNEWLGLLYGGFAGAAALLCGGPVLPGDFLMIPAGASSLITAAAAIRLGPRLPR